MRSFPAKAALCAAFLLTVTAALPATAARRPVKGQMVPYRAIYEMSLRKAQSSTGVNSATGRMTLEWMDACSGYTVNQRIVTDLGFADGEGLLTDLRISTWESASGREFRFAFNNYMNNKLAEVTQGEARFEQGKGGIAEYKRPEERTIDLPPGTVFPSSHGADLLEAAMAGKSSLTRQVFDGAEAGTVFRAVAFIGAKRDAERKTTRRAVLWRRQLDHLESWPVIVSYYRDGDGAETPEYEVSYRMYANGVGDQLLLDYGDMVFDANLSNLTIYQMPKC